MNNNFQYRWSPASLKVVTTMSHSPQAGSTKRNMELSQVLYNNYPTTGAHRYKTSRFYHKTLSPTAFAYKYILICHYAYTGILYEINKKLIKEDIVFFLTRNVQDCSSSAVWFSMIYCVVNRLNHFTLF